MGKVKTLRIWIILLFSIVTIVAEYGGTNTITPGKAASLCHEKDSVAHTRKRGSHTSLTSSSKDKKERSKKIHNSSKGRDKRSGYRSRGYSGDGPPRERKMRLENPMTLKVLAYKHRISVEKLQELNYPLRTMIPSDTIPVRRLRLPILRIRPSYYVEQGDTWATVAEKLSVDEKMLRAVNAPFIEGELIAGQTLFPPDPPDFRWLWILFLGIICVAGGVVIMKLAIADE